MMNEPKTKHEDEENGNTLSFSINLKAREAIVAFMVILVTYFALILNPLYYMTFFFDTSIVIGAGIIILLVYEASKGNKIEIPYKPNWKSIGETIFKVTAGYFLIVGGVVIAIFAYFALLPLLHPFIVTLLWLIIFILGLVSPIAGYKIIKSLFKKETEQL